ncbi:hypothetical protein CR513_22092, partial [Mucuna pruriens]
MKKIRGAVEMGGVVSSLVQHENARAGIQRILPKNFPDLSIFTVPCIIGSRTFTDAMLDLGASINVMLTSIYKLLNLGDLEPTRIEVQLANRSVVRPLGVLEDVLVQIDVHARILSMEFGDTYVEFNIFDALKNLAEDHSTFSMDTIDGLMGEYFLLGTSSASLVRAEPDSKGERKVESDSIMQESAKTESFNLGGAETVFNSRRGAGFDSSRKESKQAQAQSDLRCPSLLLDRPQTTKLRPLPKHLKYAYLGDNQQFSMIIANNLNREQEEKLLEVLGKHKKAIG